MANKNETKAKLQRLKSKLESEMHSFLLSPNAYTGKQIDRLKREIAKLDKIVKRSKK